MTSKGNPMFDIRNGLRLATALGCALLMTACATSRSTLPLEVPPGEAAAESNGRVAVVTSVVDERQFETDPGEPSTPSLKRGDAYALSGDERKQAIARKRNGYGMALGDIVLEGSGTVEDLTRDLIVRGLVERGYQVVDAGSAPEDALRVSAVIREFWAWFTPGFVAATMEARVGTALTVSGPDGDTTLPIDGYGRNSVQVGRDGNWILTYQRAFEDYLEKQSSALSGAGL